MPRSRLFPLAACFVFGALALMPKLTYAQTVDAAIALAADVSLSIDDEEFDLQRRGYAAAVTDKHFLDAVQAGARGAIALSFIEWAGPGQQAVVAKWAVIRNQQDAAQFARMLLSSPRSFAGRTAIGDAVDFATAQLISSGVTAARKIIDVSGDGANNSGTLVTAARDSAVSKGITVNGLAIINEKTGGEPGTFLYLHTHPPGGLPNYYLRNVIGGPNAFMLQIVNFGTFADAMTKKLINEISLAAAPSRG